jgi:hypothetical protein
MKDIDVKTSGFSFDVELLLECKRKGLKIKEIPIKWRHEKGTKMNLIKDPIKMLVEIFKLRLNYR